MWNKIISKLFQPSSTSVWNNLISARGNLPESISKLPQRVTATYYQLCIHLNWTFFAICYGSGVMRRNMYGSAVFRAGSTSLHSNLPEQGRPPSTILGVRKLETLGYPMVKTSPLCVLLFWHNTGVWRTDRQTDGQICRSIYSAGKDSFAVRYKIISR